MQAALADNLELAEIVNPNSPTGPLRPGHVLREILAGVPRLTRVWVDETYTDFCGPAQTVERDAVTSANVVVCKSMSKAYALSGARVAYLAAGPHQLEALRAVTLPWVVKAVGGQMRRGLGTCRNPGCRVEAASRWRRQGQGGDLRFGTGELCCG